jgi:hypothetical protein
MGVAGTNASGGTGGAGASGTNSGGSGGSGGEPSSTTFPAALSVDVWVVGWSGGLDHYSWIRFAAADDTGSIGTWQARDATCAACTGYLPCKGATGTWTGTKPSGALFEVTLTPPPGCADQKPHVWEFVDVAQPEYPPRAEFATHLRIDAQNVILAERYPKAACNPTFTACAW